MEVNKNIKASSSKLKADVEEFVPKTGHLQSCTSPTNVLDNSNLTYFEDHGTHLYVHCDPGSYNVQQSFDYFGGMSGVTTAQGYFDFPTSDPNAPSSPAWPLECDKRPGSKEEFYSLFPTESKKKNRKKKMSENNKDPRKNESDYFPRAVGLPQSDMSMVWPVKPTVKVLSRQDKLPTNEINVASMNWPGLKPKLETEDEGLKDSHVRQGMVKETFAELLKKPPREQPQKPDVQGNFSKEKSEVKIVQQIIKPINAGRVKQPDKPGLSQSRKNNWKNSGFDDEVVKICPENKKWTDAAKLNDEKTIQRRSQPVDPVMKLEQSYKSAHLRKQKREPTVTYQDNSELNTRSLPTNLSTKGTSNSDLEKNIAPNLVRHEGSTMSWSSVVGKKVDHVSPKDGKRTHNDKTVEVKLSNAEAPVPPVSSKDLITITNAEAGEDEKVVVGEEKKELTEEERELLRIKRRERRKREKENKKKQKEEEQRKKLYEPKTSKIQFISSDILQKVNERPTNEVRTEKLKGIKFLDEEYPDLSTVRKKRDKSPKPIVLWREARDSEGKLVSDAESNSEWETEDESRHSGWDTGAESEPQSDVDLSVPELKTEPELLSYSSILKSKSVPKEDAKKTENVVKNANVKTDADKKVENKKVKEKNPKKKDPIAFDLFSAFKATVKKQKEQATVKKQKEQPKKVPQVLSKSTPVLGGKLHKEVLGTTVRNKLDSSAPTRRRGKEREGGKKKKPTKMKKIILVDREKRKLARKEAEARRTERIEAGITLKPLESKDFIETETPIEEEIDDGKMAETKLVKEEEIEPNNSLTNNTLDVQILQNEAVVNKIEDPIDEVELKAKSAVHSKKFRDYCNNDLSPELGKAVTNLMLDLVRFQDKQHEKDPVKAKARRRYVVGLREVKKFMKVKKIHCLILAPDIEKVSTEKGLDDFVSDLLVIAKENSIDVIFALNRRKLGQICKKKVPVSCIGIMNHQGSESNFNLMQELVADLRITYSKKISKAMANLTQEGSRFCYNNNEIVPSHNEFSLTHQQHQFHDNQTGFGLDQQSQNAFDAGELTQPYSSEQFVPEYYYYSDFGAGQQISPPSNATGYQMYSQEAQETQQVGRKLLDILRN